MLPNLKLLRKEYHISQQALADAIQVSQPSINKYENHNIEPEIAVLKRMAALFQYIHRFHRRPHDRPPLHRMHGGLPAQPLRSGADEPLSRAQPQSTAMYRPHHSYFSGTIKERTRFMCVRSFYAVFYGVLQSSFFESDACSPVTPSDPR